MASFAGARLARHAIFPPQGEPKERLLGRLKSRLCLKKSYLSTAGNLFSDALLLESLPIENSLFNCPIVRHYTG